MIDWRWERKHEKGAAWLLVQRDAVRYKVVRTPEGTYRIDRCNPFGCHLHPNEYPKLADAKARVEHFLVTERQERALRRAEDAVADANEIAKGERAAALMLMTGVHL